MGTLRFGSDRRASVCDPTGRFSRPLVVFAGLWILLARAEAGAQTLKFTGPGRGPGVVVQIATPVPVISLTWGIETPLTIGSRGPTASQGTLGRVVLVKPVDRSSPKLFLASASRRPYDAVEFSLENVTYTFKSVYVASVRPIFEKGQALREEVTLVAAVAEVTVQGLRTHFDQVRGAAGLERP
jgi:type VI protein secretion system component Hcp